jgi:predicted DNA binding CopG/RHH family protein
MKYTDEELELVEAFEDNNIERVAFDNDDIKEMALKTYKQLNQKKQISINIKVSDLEYIKQRANDIGISYQNIIQALLHNYTTGKVKLKL